MYNLRNPKQRARYRRATFKRRDSNFGAAERIIRSVFARERKVMISALPRVGKVDKGEWTKAFKQVWILAGGDAWKYSEETWGGAQRSNPKPKKSIDLYLSYKQAPTAWLTYVADYIDTKGGDKIDDITDTTKDKLQHAIFAGVEQEEGIPDIAKRVSDVYDGFEGSRSTMIARSEVVEASNRASEQQVIDSNSDLMMVWISTGDDRTRDEHLAMDDADPVPPGGEFDCEDGTTFPGDAVNCRCTVGYVLPGEGAKPTESVLAERERRAATEETLTTLSEEDRAQLYALSDKLEYDRMGYNPLSDEERAKVYQELSDLSKPYFKVTPYDMPQESMINNVVSDYETARTNFIKYISEHPDQEQAIKDWVLKDWDVFQAFKRDTGDVGYNLTRDLLLNDSKRLAYSQKTGVLESLLNNAPQVEVNNTWRGIRIYTDEQYAKYLNYAPGSELIDKGFIATSTNQDFPYMSWITRSQKYDETARGVVMEVRNARGVAVDLDAISDQKEILISPQTKFRVISRTQETIEGDKGPVELIKIVVQMV